MNNKGYTLIELLISLALIWVFVFMVGVGILASKGCSKVQEDGLKSVIERVWEGDKRAK